MSTFITKLSLFSIFFLFLLVLSAPSVSAVCCAGFIAGKTSYINWESCPGRTAKVDDDNCDNSGGKSSSVQCEAPACPSGWSDTYPNSCEGKNGPAISAMSTKKTCTGTSGKKKTTTLATRACYRCTAVSAACVNNNCGNGSMLNTTSGTSYTCLGYNVNGATISCQKGSPSQTSFTFTSTCNSNCEQTVTTFAAGRSNIKKQICHNDVCSYTPAQEECLDKAMAAGLTREEAWENICQFLASDTPEPTPKPQTSTYTPAQEECLDKAMAAGLTREEAWENVCQFLTTNTPSSTTKPTSNKPVLSNGKTVALVKCPDGTTDRCIELNRNSKDSRVVRLSDEELATLGIIESPNNKKYTPIAYDSNDPNSKVYTGLLWLGTNVNGARHLGVDVHAPEGTAVRARDNGVVIGVIDKKGNAAEPWINVQYPDGTILVYTHLNIDPQTIKEGSIVQAGQTLGTVNSADHVHIGQVGKQGETKLIAYSQNPYEAIFGVDFKSSNSRQNDGEKWQETEFITN